jgi:hypothetical protein
MKQRSAPAGSSCRIGVIHAHAWIMTKAGEGPEAEQGYEENTMNTKGSSKICMKSFWYTRHPLPHANKSSKTNENSAQQLPIK